METESKVHYSNAFEGARNFSIGAANVAGRDVHVHVSPEEDIETKIVKISTWLSPTNYWLYHNDTTLRRTADTGIWFLHAAAFKRWIATPSAALWVTGMPGAGKTVLASTAIDYLRSSSAGHSAVVFVYCRYTDHCTAGDVLRTFIKQLLETHPKKVYDTIDHLYSAHKTKQTQLTDTEARNLLSELLPAFKTTYVVIDGLDEVLDDEQTNLLMSLSTFAGTHILILSRPLDLFEEDIHLSFDRLSIEARNEDIELFVRDRIHQSSRLRSLLRHKQPLIDQISTQIKGRSRGMFLVAALQIEALNGCLNMKALMAALESMPSGIDEMYSRTMKRIEDRMEEESTLAKKALLWVTHSLRPLTMDELQAALATFYEQGVFDEDAVTPSDLILSACCGLIIVEQKSRKVRLIHYTAQEYLRGLASPTFPDHRIVTSLTCITHLLHHQLPQQHPTTFSSPRQLESYGGFMSYAYAYWGVHAQALTTSDSAQSEALSKISHFLKMCQQLPFNYSTGTSPTDWNPNLNFDYFDLFGPCHIAARFGLTQVFSQVKHNHQPSDVQLWTALHVSVIHDQHEMVDLLLTDNDFPSLNLNAQDRHGNTALHLAVKGGNTTIVRSLLNHPKVEVNIRCSHQTVPLILAVSNRFVSITNMLLDHPSIDVNSVTERGESALHLTLNFGVGFGTDGGTLEKLLLHPFININSLDIDGRSPLLVAVSRNDVHAVEKLLAMPGIDLDVRDGTGDTALLTACRYADEPIATMLIERENIDVNAADERGYTPLIFSIVRSQHNIVQRLLSHPTIDPNLCTLDGISPLMAASRHGLHPIIQSLLSHNRVRVSVVNQQCHGIARTEAMRWWDRPHLGNSLLGHDIEVNATSADLGGITALAHAAACGLGWNFDTLLGHPSVDPNLGDTKGHTPLMIASLARREDFVQKLLAHPQVDINTRSNEGDTALSWVAIDNAQELTAHTLFHPPIPVNLFIWQSEAIFLHQRDYVANLLLSHPTLNPNLVCDEQGRTPLMLAVLLDLESAVQKLLFEPQTLASSVESPTTSTLCEPSGSNLLPGQTPKKNVQTNTRDLVQGDTALIIACRGGNESITRLLLSHTDIDVKVGNNANRTPLMEASHRGHTKIAKRLITHHTFVPTHFNEYDDAGNTALLWAAYGGDDGLVVKLLTSHPDINVNHQNRAGENALIVASSNNLPQSIRMLLARSDIGVNLGDACGTTALMVAAKGDSEAAATLDLLLCDPRTNINQTDLEGKSAIHYAVEAATSCSNLLDTNSTIINRLISDCRIELAYLPQHSEAVSPVRYTLEGDANYTHIFNLALLRHPLLDVDCMTPQDYGSTWYLAYWRVLQIEQASLSVSPPLRKSVERASKVLRAREALLIDVEGPGGRRVPHHAMMAENEDLFRLIVYRPWERISGLDVNAKDVEGKTVLDRALDLSCAAMEEFLQD